VLVVPIAKLALSFEFSILLIDAYSTGVRWATLEAAYSHGLTEQTKAEAAAFLFETHLLDAPPPD